MYIKSFLLHAREAIAFLDVRTVVRNIDENRYSRPYFQPLSHEDTDKKEHTMLAYLQWILMEYGFDKAADAVFRFRTRPAERRMTHRVSTRFAAARARHAARREMYEMNLEFPNPDFTICPVDGGCVHADHTHSHQLVHAGR